MNQGCRWLAALAALALPLAAQAQVDLAGLDRDMTGPRTRILVLGTVHLGEHEDDFRPEKVAGLLDRLAAYRPDYVTIEALSGEQCDLAHRHPAYYDPDFCALPEQARAATGLDIPSALAAVDKTLSAWPAQPSPAQRRHLAALFLAADDPASAYVQWLRLPAGERRAGDGLDAALVAGLRHSDDIASEDFRIAAPLAARLGLERVYPVDDHTGDNHRIDDVPAFAREVEAAWKAGRGPLDEIERRQAELMKADDWLPLYRAVNQPASLAVTAELNVSAALRATSPRHYPQIWVNGWQLRNLRMVGNVLQVVRDRPGGRVLSIVGMSHKPWFDDWLGQMQGVDIVDAEQVLR